MKTKLLNPIHYFFLASLFFAFTAMAQEEITLINPSFESMPRAGEVGGYGPQAWMDCSHPDQSSVDIQPGQFRVYLPAHEGKSYIGMVARDGETWEGISQRLTAPMKAGQKYVIVVHLAKAEHYISRIKASEVEQNFDNPLQLRIWGGDGYCSKKELLVKSPIINHHDWQAYQLAFEPNENHSYLFLEGYYMTPTLRPYNGNILVDDCSSLQPISSFAADHITLDNKFTTKDYPINYNTDFTGLIPYELPSQEKSVNPKESAPRTRYIERTKSSITGYNKELLAELNVEETSLDNTQLGMITTIGEFIQMEEKRGWVKYLENHSDEEVYSLTEQLKLIGATDASGYLVDYQRAGKLAPRQANARRGQLLHEDKRKASLKNVRGHLKNFLLSSE